MPAVNRVETMLSRRNNLTSRQRSNETESLTSLKQPRNAQPTRRLPQHEQIPVTERLSRMGDPSS